MCNLNHQCTGPNINAISPPEITNEVSNSSHLQNCNKNETIHVCMLNVCGLKSKMLSPDFEEFIFRFDIVALTETKMSDLDNINDMFREFDIFYKNRRLAKRASGGVALLVKKNISNHVHIHEPTTNFENNISDDFIMWVKIEKLFKVNVLLGITYIPPESSPYSSIDMFHVLENQLMSLADMNMSLCLMGDLNARTKNLEDMITVDKCNVDINCM